MGGALAVILAFATAPRGSEPLVTGPMLWRSAWAGPSWREGTGRSVVILQAGLGASSSAWERIRPTTIGDVPLIVVSADTGTQRGWGEAQAAQATLSTNGVHRVIARATHESFLDAHSAASSDANLDAVAGVREGKPVS